MMDTKKLLLTLGILAVVGAITGIFVEFLGDIFSLNPYAKGMAVGLIIGLLISIINPKFYEKK
ncbi:MAG: hypothetical protein ABIF85_03675 [Nanoarchaeota archaeon]|nr:hypothetical protein [Nanoarchaeota archaeon]MBU4452265.1 hypothetical protein [Nanoarchaeota archaeon]MCG2724536.1 hypothetical protein [archaeon]